MHYKRIAGINICDVNKHKNAEEILCKIKLFFIKLGAICYTLNFN